MILKKLTLENFRQFRGVHTLEFATQPDQNVTLILGYNTFGKSALLNAINFALYGEVQDDLDDPSHLLNFEAEKSRENQFSIDLEFEFQGAEYHIQRKRVYTYHAGSRISSNDQVELHQISPKSGSWKIVPLCEPLVNRAIPREMAPSFIFHGEKRVNEFATTGTHKRVGEAIRKVLGCNLVELAIADLSRIGKKLETAIAKESGDAQVEQLQVAKDSWEAKLKEIEDKIRKKDDEIETAGIEKGRLDQQLRDHDRTKEIKGQLDRAEEARKRCETNRDGIQREIWRWIKESTITVASSAAAVAALDAIDLEEVRGKIPSDYQESFIQSLLESHLCICNRELLEGSKEWDAVTKLLERGGKKDVMDIILKVKAGADRHLRSISRARNELTLLQDRLHSLDGEVGTYEIQIEEFKQRLQGVDVQELARKAEQCNKLDVQIKELSRHIGDLDRKKRVEVQPKIRELEKAIEQKVRGRPQVEKSRRVKNLIGELLLFLAKELATYEEEAREQVLQLTNENLSVMHRDKEAFFDSKFNLGLRERDTKIQGGKSTGEAQLLVLAFTSALIRFCSKREQAEDEFLIPGTVAPLILDAPFGQLDTVFQRGAISWIPRMARQVVLFVSDAQARIMLENKDSMERVGACYALQIPPGQKASPPYKLNGTSYPSQNNREDKSTSIQRIW